MNNQVAVFIDNRSSSIKTYFNRLVYKKFNAPPLAGHKRLYWYHERWEVMKKNGAIPTLCGWCGQLVPAYPINFDGSDGTLCHECGRSIDDFYRGWFYRAEYSDGCRIRLSQGLLSESGAGHGTLENHVEIPAYEFLHPLLFSTEKRFTKEEFCMFFRKSVRDKKERLYEGESEIQKFIKSLPFPYREISVGVFF